MVSFKAKQVNYPLDVKVSWKQPEGVDSDNIWKVSIRTLRNCMFDAYSDCPFYEQLQYSGDSRSVGVFHYLLDLETTDSCIKNSQTSRASVTIEGLTQARFPSHVPQLIAGFPLYWILQRTTHKRQNGARYIGSFTVLDLVKSGFEVIVVDNLSIASEKVFNRLEQLSGEIVKFYKTDVTDPAGLAKTFVDNPGLYPVIHPAALKAVAESRIIPLEYYYNNVGGTITLLRCIVRHSSIDSFTARARQCTVMLPDSKTWFQSRRNVHSRLSSRTGQPSS
ncbi:hypothetical protein LTR41_011469 [Exophiala xenobiotica]|nr:hypothetical protein LTR41_011469 [Exophiala xenobiotica]KAK5332588.1 hypothetical protein LTR98_011273 [Exophiala xenobiotica]